MYGGIGEYFRRSYIGEGWHARDIRAERGVPMLLRGVKVVTEQDLVTPEEMQRAGLYAESLVPNGLQWFAAIGLFAGPSLWALSIQRTRRQGAFEEHDKNILGQLAPRLTEVATLSRAVGQATLTGMTNALGRVDQPALALDRSAFVLDINRLANQLFDDEVRVRNRRLVVRDRRAMAALDAFIDQLRLTPDMTTLPVMPIVVHRFGKRPLVISVLPIDGAARTPFLGARVLLTFSDLGAEILPDSTVVARAFGLSPAETRLAMLIGNGTSPSDAAEELGIARETARSQLKNVFAKTGTHRQAELVALLARIARLPKGGRPLRALRPLCAC